MSRRLRLSGVVVTQDNADTLGRVLACLGRVCDEIVVVDGGSRDATPEIVLACPRARLYHRPFDGDLARQKNFAMDQALGEWLLVLDTDELLCPRALAAIPRLVRHPWRRWYKFARCWVAARDGRLGRVDSPLHWPDWQLRLFRNAPPFRYDPGGSPIHHNFPRSGRGPGRKLRGRHILHYDLLLQDAAARRAKVERYRRMDPRSERTHGMYLWEEAGAGLAPLPHACREVEPLAPRP